MVASERLGLGWLITLSYSCKQVRVQQRTRTSVRRREKGSILVPVSLVLKQVRVCTMRLEPRYDVTAESALQPIADFNILDTQIHVSRSVSAIYPQSSILTDIEIFQSM